MAKILVVDDHHPLVRRVQRELEGSAHEVLTASDREEALEMIRRERPSLVVLDVTMPGKTDVEVLREVKSDPGTRETVVIMLTATDDDTQMTRCLKLGADWYLVKPFLPGDISCLARRFLAAGASPAA